MSFETNWDVSKYYDPTEFHEHWNLRKEFMLTHKDKYPEDRLAALAKIFFNMEFMGCIYKSEIMILVSNLSEQVDAIVQYRDKKKIKLQRTFVKASDAVKKHINNSNANTRAKVKYVNFIAANNIDDGIETECKRPKFDSFINNKTRPELNKYAEVIINSKQVFDQSQPEPTFVQIGQQYLKPDQFMPVGYEMRVKQQPLMQPMQQPLIQPMQQPLMQPMQQPLMQPMQQPVNAKLSNRQKRLQKSKKLKESLKQKHKLRFHLNINDRKLVDKARNQKGILGNLVLYKTQKHASMYGSLVYSASKSYINIKMIKDTIKKNYVLFMNDEHIAECPILIDPKATSKVTNKNRKNKTPDIVRNELAKRAFKHLEKYCFTLIDHSQIDDNKISTDSLKGNQESTEPQIALSMDGIGARIMNKMGWSGKGLGKNSDGIIEPIEAEIRVYRSGLGKDGDIAIDKSIRSYLYAYLASGETKRLFFSTDYSKEDRARIHSISEQIGFLKSKSYGKGKKRYLTIERKFSNWERVEELLSKGGSNHSYTVIKPTAL